MITVKNLSIRFNKQQEIHFSDKEFGKGLVHGVIGLNGAGKTTFFNLLAGALKPTTGSLSIEGASISRKVVCYLETSNYFYTGITGNEYLKLFPATNNQFSLDNMNGLMRLPLDQLTESYSTGMKKRLALMAILKQDKPVYIFDEPFNGLDLETSRVLQLSIELLKSKGKTIFISSHILETLTNLCDEIHLLEKGKFKHHYLPESFARINQDLFGGFEQEAASIVARSM